MAADDASRTDRKRAAVFLVIVSVALLLVAIIRFSSGDQGREGGDTAALPSVELTAAGDVTVSTDDLLGQPLAVLLDIDAATYPDMVDVTLEFDDGTTLDFTAEVRQIGDTEGEMDMNMDDDVEPLTTDG